MHEGYKAAPSTSSKEKGWSDKDKNSKDSTRVGGEDMNEGKDTDMDKEGSDIDRTSSK